MLIHHIWSDLFTFLQVWLLFGPDGHRVCIKAFQSSVRMAMDLHLLWISTCSIMIWILEGIYMLQLSKETCVIRHVPDTISWLSILTCFLLNSVFCTLRIALQEIRVVLDWTYLTYGIDILSKVALTRHFGFELLACWDFSLLSQSWFLGFHYLHTWMQTIEVKEMIILACHLAHGVMRLWYFPLLFNWITRAVLLQVARCFLSKVIDTIFVSH